MVKAFHIDDENVQQLSHDVGELFADAEAEPLEAIAAMAKQIIGAAQAVPGVEPEMVLDWAASLLDG